MLGVTGLVVFFGYGPLFELVGGGIPGRVLGATSRFAILMTMFLLNKQTEIEQDKRDYRVFDEKIHLYKNVVDRTQHLLDDGQLDSTGVGTTFYFGANADGRRR